jgi:plastocyanin
MGLPTIFFTEWVIPTTGDTLETLSVRPGDTLAFTYDAEAHNVRLPSADIITSIVL